MENHHTIVQMLAQNSPPWLLVALGHWSADPLSSVALLTAIAYNIVNIWAHFRKKK
jgi:hypothetical protein